MSALLAAIALWLAANFDLPTSAELPTVELATTTQIQTLRYDGIVHDARHTAENQSVAVYIDKTKTIYLPATWKPDNAADLSILVHEMVHHLQNVGNLKFACLAEREELAYQAQEAWLKLFGRDLRRDFELDPFTLLVKTRCMP
jgi:uncharacterized protein DUF6647